MTTLSPTPYYRAIKPGSPEWDRIREAQGDIAAEIVAYLAGNWDDEIADDVLAECRDWGLTVRDPRIEED